MVAFLNRMVQTQNKVFASVVIFILVISSRLPFLDAGYGLDPDAWRVANTAKWISVNGAYRASRLPGYPVQEIVSSLVWRWGPIALNGLSVMFAAVGCVALYLALSKMKLERPVLIVITLALTPVVYVASTVSLDYMWGFGFAMLALWQYLEKRPALSGIFMGFAIGCRLSYLLFLLPFIFLGKPPFSRTRLLSKDFAIFTGTALALAIVAYLPAFITYQANFLQVVEPGRTPLQVLRLLSTGIWGRIGAAGLSIALILFGLAIYKNPKRLSGLLKNKSNIIYFSASTLFIFTLLFIRLPIDSGHLIPLLPFALIMMSICFDKTTTYLVFGSIVLSSFVNLDISGLTAGRIIADNFERKAQITLVHQLLATAANLPDNAVLVGGEWFPIATNDLFTRPKNLVFLYSVSLDKASRLIEGGNVLYYFPGQRDLIKYPADTQHIIPLQVEK